MTDSAPQRTDLPSAFLRLWGLLDQHERRRALLVVALMLASALSEVLGVATVMPFIAVLANPEVVTENRWIRMAYDAVGFENRTGFMVTVGLLFFVSLLLSLFIKGFSNWVQFRFATNRGVAWSHRLIAAYLAQPYAWFLSRDTSVLGATVLGEVENVISTALLPAMMAIARAILVCLLLVLLVAVDARLALGAGVVLGGGFAIATVATRARLQRAGEERLRATRERFTIVQEAFGGIKAVKLAGNEQFWLDRFRYPLETRARWAITQSLIEQVPPLLMQAIMFGGLLLILTYLVATRGSLQQALPVIGLYALAGYRLMPAVQGVFEGITRIRGADALISSLSADFDAVGHLEPAVPPPSGHRSPIDRGATLAFEEVTFLYPTAVRPALNKVSFTLPPHRTLGIVGGTGSGKSTLVDLMMGLLEPTEGTVLVDGSPLTGATLRSWQQGIGYVPQQIFLTNDSVRANIAFGISPKLVDQQAVERAARAAHLHDYICNEMPAGYATPVGERGISLSGGQRQRVGIARALYRDPSVLILDEATSALDSVTEAAVMRAVHGLGGQKTIVMIAHRLSTVRQCDQIIVLEHGSIVATGTYDELLAGNDRFRQLAAVG